MVRPAAPQPRREVLRVPLVAHGGLASVCGLAPSGVARDVIDFSTAVNAFGPAPTVVEAVRAVRPDRYPDPRSSTVRQTAARWWHRPPEEIAFGAGVSELLHALAFAFLRSGDRVAVAMPAYEEYARASALCGARVLSTDCGVGDANPDLSRLADTIRAHQPRLAFACAPNNPTGCATTSASLRELAGVAAAHGALLVLDQSYDAFSARPLGTPALAGHPNVIHLRSITKDHALAGVRAGFALGPAAIINALERVRAPWPVSAYAQAAAAAALSTTASAHVTATTAVLRGERERVVRALSDLGVPTLPSDTHILLVEVGDATAVRQQLFAAQGILVRDATSFGLPGHIRVAARTSPENNLLLAALRTARCGSRDLAPARTIHVNHSPPSKVPPP